MAAVCLLAAWLLPAGGPNAAGAAEISERQDIAVFGVTASGQGLPESSLAYIDSSITQVLVNLKRFNVLGYGEYRLGSGEIGEFIERIREIRTEKAKEAGEYDEKFGTLVIRGEDFDRIVNSFIVVVPNLVDYRRDRERSSVIRDGIAYLQSMYTVEVTIDLTFVHVQEGEMKQSLRIQGTGSGDDPAWARRKAIDSAVSSLKSKVREIEEFKIKSGVVEVRGDTVFFQPGADMGISPGDEYRVMTLVEVARTGRVTRLPTGLVRVKESYPELSEARIVTQAEPITEGDQLVELSTAGVTVSFTGGVMQVDIPDMDYDIHVIEDGGGGDTGSASFGQKHHDAVAVAGVSVKKSLGYRFYGVFDAQAMLNLPLFGGVGELGVGAVFHKRRFTLNLAAQGGILYLTTFKSDLKETGSGNLTIDGVTIDFWKEPVMNVYGIGAGLKGSAGLSVLLKPGFTLSTDISYRQYTPIRRWYVNIEETMGGDVDSVTFRSDSGNVVVDSTSKGFKPVDISGFAVTASLSLRF
jgi:hypothetical protein